MFGAVFVPAVFSRMSVFDTDEIEIFLPIRTFLLERDSAETGFYPVRRAVLRNSGLFHVMQVFISGDRAASQRAVGNGLKQWCGATGFKPCFH